MNDTQYLLERLAALYQRPHYSLDDSVAVWCFNDTELTVGDLRKARTILNLPVERTERGPCAPLPPLGEFSQSMRRR